MDHFGDEYLSKPLGNLAKVPPRKMLRVGAMVAPFRSGRVKWYPAKSTLEVPVAKRAHEKGMLGSKTRPPKSNSTIINSGRSYQRKRRHHDVIRDQVRI